MELLNISFLNRDNLAYRFMKVSQLSQNGSLKSLRGKHVSDFVFRPLSIIL